MVLTTIADAERDSYLGNIRKCGVLHPSKLRNVRCSSCRQFPFYATTHFLMFPYMAGDEFTMADISAMAGLSYVEFAKIETPPEPTQLAAWRARVNVRPGVAAIA